MGLVVTEGLVLAHDVPHAGPNGLRGDHVVGLNPPALLLARLTVRRPVGAALDVGCGGGVQSLLAARHATRVVGVDLNPRAITFARFNARLNGVTNVEFREGDLFAPVSGERFELVICNPPYVISPETELLFRDGGRAGDSFSRGGRAGGRLAPRAGRLRDGARQLGGARPRALVGGCRALGAGPGCCDAWLLRMDTKDTLSYAASWNRQPDAARYAAALDRWLAYYDAHGIRAISMGAVILRKRATGVPWPAPRTCPRRPAPTRGRAAAASRRRIA